MTICVKNTTIAILYIASVDLHWQISAKKSTLAKKQYKKTFPGLLITLDEKQLRQAQGRMVVKQTTQVFLDKTSPILIHKAHHCSGNLQPTLAQVKPVVVFSQVWTKATGTARIWN